MNTTTHCLSVHDVRLARARRSLEGLSLGDAFGERFFLAPAVALRLIEERALPAPTWMWTDDTAMALSIYETLARLGAIDRDALAEAFGRRYVEEPYRGYGGTAHSILRAIAEGTPWHVIAPSVFSGQGSMGNGGAMRVAPVGAYFSGDLARVVAEARASAEPTHAHPDGQAGAIAIAVAAAASVELAAAGRAQPGPAILEAALAHTPEGDTHAGIRRALGIPLDAKVAHVARMLGTGEGVISSDTVPFSLWCAARHLDDFEAAMWTTVEGLGDRDTTCAIVGGIVALSTRTALPAEWIRAREGLPV